MNSPNDLDHSNPFSQLIACLPDAVLVVGRDGCIGFANPMATTLFGYLPGELQGLPLEELVPERFRQAHVRHRSDFARAPHVRPMGNRRDIWARRKDGTEFPVDIMLSPLHRQSPSGEVVVVIRDATDRWEKERELLARKQRLKAAMYSLKAALDDRNRATRRAAANLVAQHLADASDLCEALPRILTATCVALECAAGEFRQVTADGLETRSLARWSDNNDIDSSSGGTPGAGLSAVLNNPLWVNGHVVGEFWLYRRTPGVWEPEEVEWLRGLVAQVGLWQERRHADAALRESEQRFRLMADSAPVLIWVTNAEHEGIYFNKTWLDFTGRTFEQERGNGWAAGIHPGDREGVLAGRASAGRSREPFEMEFRLRRCDGEFRWVIDRANPRLSPAGDFLGYVGLCLDITDRRATENAVRESEERHRSVLAALHEGLIYWDAGGRVRTCNASAEKIMGVSPGALLC